MPVCIITGFKHIMDLLSSGFTVFQVGVNMTAVGHSRSGAQITKEHTKHKEGGRNTWPGQALTNFMPAGPRRGVFSGKTESYVGVSFQEEARPIQYSGKKPARPINRLLKTKVYCFLSFLTGRAIFALN